MAFLSFFFVGEEEEEGGVSCVFILTFNGRVFSNGGSKAFPSCPT